MTVTTVDWDRWNRCCPIRRRAGLARLGVGSGTVVPLVARGQTLGALGLFSREDRGALSPAEVDTAIEIGLRAGLALHHARLFGQQRALADALQRSMLTDPPEPDHSHIVVRVPAAAGAEIGGDWYDAFLQPGGATVVAIGDVVGHDTRAAAAMGQVRGLLRGIGYSSGGSPAEVLTELDRAIEGLALDTMATALVARLEQDEDDLRGGAGRVPLVQRGTPAAPGDVRRRQVALLDDTASELLLGVAPETERREHVAVLEAGATLLLYTDGLVERRDRTSTPVSPSWSKVLRECAALPLEDLCDEVLKRLFLPDAQDDVAMLAVRCTRRTSRARRRPVSRSCRGHRARARRDTRIRRRRLSYGRRRRLAGRGRARQVDGDRRRPAAPDRQHPQRGDQHDDGGDRQRVQPERPGEHGQRGPRSGATAL